MIIGKPLAPALPQVRPLLLPILVATALGGCATQEYVHQEVGQYEQRISALESWLSTITQGIDGNGKRLGAMETRLDQVEKSGASLAARVETTQSGLLAADRRVDKLNADLADATRRIDADRAETGRAMQRLAGMDTRFDATTSRLEGASAGLAQVEKRIDVLEARASQAAASVAKESSVANPPDAASTVAVIQPSVRTEAVTASLPAEPVATHAVTQPAIVATPLPDGASAPAAAGALPAERVAVNSTLIAELDRKIENQGGTLNATDGRLAALESRLVETSQQSQVQEALLRATDRKIGAIQQELDRLRQKADANTEAITLVDNRVGEVNANLDEAHKRVEEGEKVLAESGLRLTMVQELIKGQSERLSRSEQENDKASTTALEALERAKEAGKLAEGKLVFETTLTDEIANFRFQEATLNDAAKRQLDEFAGKLKAENRNVFIEIQGYTDSLGSSSVNQRLSRARAQAVRDYLNQEAGIPLHRLAIAAYGESKPVGDNATREGRSRNRRVVLVVLQ